MAAIYENSYVTVSANNKSGVLLGDTDMRNTGSGRFVIDRSSDASLAMIVKAPHDHERFFATSLEGVTEHAEHKDDYPLSMRAWCFQERLLATRILHFLDQEIVFECKTACDCECGSSQHRKLSTPLKYFYDNIIRKDFTAIGLAKDAWEGWTMFAAPYIQKDITKSLDILPALAGVASRMQTAELGQYIAGLWEHQLPRGLFWYADVISSHETMIQSAPTFSWAALAATSKVRELQWPYWADDIKMEQHFKVINFQCPVAGLNPYGFVSTSTAFINLQAFILPSR